MSVFPLFIDLKGKKCIVIGGGSVAARKIQVLKEFNADIVVVSPVIIRQIEELIQRGFVLHKEKEYSESDILEAFMVIAATSDKDVNDRIYNDAVRNGIFVNVADCPEKCTFIFPAIVKRSDLVVGISTSGSYPVLSKVVKERIDGMLTENIDDRILQALRRYRQRAIDEISDIEKRKKILGRLLDETVFCHEAVELEQLDSKIDKIFGE